MKKFLKFMTKLVAITGLVAAAAYAIKKFFIDNKEDEFAENYTDLEYQLDDDLKPVPDREYVPIHSETVEKGAEETKEAAADSKESVKAAANVAKGAAETAAKETKDAAKDAAENIKDEAKNK